MRTSLKKKGSILAALLAVQMLPLLVAPHLSAAFKRVAAGDRPPPFELENLDGDQVRSSDLYGKGVTVVVFWATWSPRSSEILADLESLRRELGKTPFTIVALNAEHTVISPGDRKSIGNLSRELGLSATMLLDDGLKTYNDYGAMALPSTLVVDERGIVTFELAGYPTTMRSDLADGIRKALGLPTSEELRPPEPYMPKNHAMMYFNFGKRLMEKGQEEKAEAKLLEAVERDPDFVRPRLLLGVYFKKTGRLQEAITHFRKVREIEPDNTEAGYQEAAASFRAGDMTAAERLFRGLHEEFPEREEFALGVALTAKYQGRREEYEAAIKLAGGLVAAEPRMHYEFGGVAEDNDDLAEAARLYRLALEGSLKRQW
jgi:tetratricopeptide (TPR) repeat protein